MAGRAPHPHPIMEPPPRFDLDQAVAAWRAELARHPGPAPADLRELEAHLRDGFAELKKKDLSDEEAFLVARHRIGPSAPVADEFTKIATKRSWAPRVFWLVFGVFALLRWQEASLMIWRVILSLFAELSFDYSGSPGNWEQDLLGNYIPAFECLLLYLVPLVVAAFWLARGVPRFLAKRLVTRHSVAMTGLGMFLWPMAIYFINSTIVDFLNTYIRHGTQNLSNEFFVRTSFKFLPILGNSFFISLVWPLLLFTLMVWLAPGQTTTAGKTATAA